MKRQSRPWSMLPAMLIAAGLLGAALQAQETRFADLVGPGNVGPVAQTAPLQVPYITWGGDMATFYANGGLTTKAGSIFQKQGLNLRLNAADDFVQQVRDYRAGKTPFLRGTFHMIGLASEVIGSDPRTKGVFILQLTWSAGDHLVARESLKTPIAGAALRGPWARIVPPVAMATSGRSKSARFVGIGVAIPLYAFPPRRFCSAFRASTRSSNGRFSVPMI